MARAYLADGKISDVGFERMVKANRFGNALRLDAGGVVREAHPRTPGLIGSDIAGRYAHLRRALSGHVAISNVVSSAALGVPVVGIATPFDTTAGRAVLSTGYEVIDSPLTAYLQGAIATASDHVYLVDANDNIVTAKTRAPRRITALAAREPELARALGDDATSGTIVEGGERRFFVQRKVAGTPWRFVVAMPVAEAHASRQGDRHRVRAVLIGALAVAALMIAVLVGRLIDANAGLRRDVHRRQEVERELIRDRELLSHQATHDLLTGLPNRTVLLDRLDAALAGTPARDESVSAVFFVDLDRFKPINDRYGHDTGPGAARDRGAPAGDRATG